jgi:hypothetical protein
MGLMFDVNFKENSLLNTFEYDGARVGFDGVNYTPDDGFVSVNTGGFLELDGTLPNFVAQSIMDQSWVVQFKAFASSGQNRKLILTTSPSSTALIADLSGFSMFITDLGISVKYYKGAGDVLVEIVATMNPSVDLTVGIHQA